MIKRTIEPVMQALSRKYPVITVTGPRQSGKTTLCRTAFPEKAYVNLEAPDIRSFAMSDPRGFLSGFPDGAILDEVQRVPELLSYIQTIVDERSETGLFVLTGSQQFEVLNTVNQSLAGRAALIKLLPLSIEELKTAGLLKSVDRLLVTGFYPRIYDKDLNPTQALGDYFETYVERDLRQLAAIKEIRLFEKFVRLCAGRVGQILNLQSLANDTGVSHTTAHAWISLLEASYIVYLLKPWHGNVSKRLIKSPKLYFYDVGLAAYLLGIENEVHASRDPLRGNLFENAAVAEALKFRFNRAKRANVTFYRDGRGNEIDLVFEKGRDVFPVEIKAGATVTPDYLSALKKCGGLFDTAPWGSGLIYGGEAVNTLTGARIYPLADAHDLFAHIEGAEDESWEIRNTSLT